MYLGLIYYTTILLLLAGWVTHVAWAIITIFGPTVMTVNQAVLAILGGFLFPFGAIHGLTLWLQ